MPVIAEPMSTVALTKIIENDGTMVVLTRVAAQTATPLTNGEAKDITGVDEVNVRINFGADTKKLFQCVYCGQYGFVNALSGRSHLLKHSDKVQTGKKDREQVAESAENGKSVYAPYDTDQANVTFMLRVIDANAPAVRRLMRQAENGGKKVGQRTVPTEELATLKAKAKAYDEIKADALKAAERFKI